MGGVEVAGGREGEGNVVLTEVYTDTVACIYNVDGNCKGMLTPERLNILRKAIDRAKCSSLHDHVQPSPSLALHQNL